MNFKDYLKECGYTDIKLIHGHYYACINQFSFTCAILKCRIGELAIYDDRWCYHTYEDAKHALENWDGEGEPEGWHRHPATGRRRNDGKEASEYINF